MGLGYSDFYWYVDNDASQMLNSGLYYMKFEQKDEYGHSNIMIEEIHVIRVEEYVELNIFNSGGELVRKGQGIQDAFFSEGFACRKGHSCNRKRRLYDINSVWDRGK